MLIVLLHRTVAAAACRWEKFGNLVKGKEQIVVEDGRIRDGVLQDNHLSRKDLVEELRLNGNLECIDRVKKAVIERSGEISVIEQRD
jgi:uncharacterized membrane protein YcaP (DUF421 family)